MEAKDFLLCSQVPATGP